MGFDMPFVHVLDLYMQKMNTIITSVIFQKTTHKNMGLNFTI